MVSPIFSLPFFIAPPSMPPWSEFRGVPGLFMSKLLAIRNIGMSDSFGRSIFILMSSSSILSMLTFCIAETGMIGEFSAMVPFVNCFIAS